LARYEAGIEKQIESKPSQVEVDDVSLKAFVRTSRLYKDLEGAMAKKFNGRVVRQRDFKHLAAQLRYVGLTSIEELREALFANQELIMCQWVEVARGASHPSSAIGEGLALLQLALVMRSKSGVAAVGTFLKKFHYQDPVETIDETARRIVAAVQKCSSGGPASRVLRKGRRSRPS
jgi:hypothetical protein